MNKNKQNRLIKRLNKALETLNTRDRKFALSMIRQQLHPKRNNLSKKQWIWVNRLLAKYPSVSLSKVKNKHHYVYAISDGESIKIGQSLNPLLRLNALQVANASELSLVWVKLCKNKDSSNKLERTIHKTYKELNIRGEWFNYEILRIIKLAYKNYVLDMNTLNGSL